MSPTIYYAIDANPRYVAMVARSVASIRRYRSSASIAVHIFGSPRRAGVEVLEGLGATIVPHRSVSHDRRTYLKWLALGAVDSECALYLDADTVCWADPMTLFDAHPAAEFAAREEMGTQRDGRSYLLGTFIVRPQVAWPMYRRIQSALGLQFRPLFNTGVMLFRARRRVVEQLDCLERIRELWVSKQVPYPSTNPYIMEQVAAAMMFGAVDNLQYEVLAPAEAPFYLELRAGRLSSPGTVVHVWSEYYPFFLEDYEGRAAASAFVEQYCQPVAPFVDCEGGNKKGAARRKGDERAGKGERRQARYARECPPPPPAHEVGPSHQELSFPK
jgi:hypothetical protein